MSCKILILLIIDLFLSPLIVIGRRALGQAAKLRCGGSNPPGASKPHFVHAAGCSVEGSPHCRRRRQPASDLFFIRLSRWRVSTLCFCPNRSAHSITPDSRPWYPTRIDLTEVSYDVESHSCAAPRLTPHSVWTGRRNLPTLLEAVWFAGKTLP